MTAPDKIWVNPDDNTDGLCPVETDLDDVGRFFDAIQAVEYTRSDLIQPASADYVAGTSGYRGTIEQLCNALGVMASSEKRRVQLSILQAAIEGLAASLDTPALHPASPLGAVTITDEMVNRAIEAFDACDAFPTDEGDFDAMKAALAAALAAIKETKT